MKKKFIGAALFASLAFTQASQAITFERVNVSSAGTQANGGSPNYSSNSEISKDGRYVVFESFATDLVANDTSIDGIQHIYVRDRTTEQTERVSVASNGVHADQDSRSPSISADGRYVVFYSQANNLVSGYGAIVSSADYEVYIYDRNTGIIDVVSKNINGTESNGSSSEASITPNGHYVVFSSDSSDLVTGDTDTSDDVFVRDLRTGITELASIPYTEPLSLCSSYNPAISADGQHVAFKSKCNQMALTDDAGYTQLYVRDRTLNQTTLVSVNNTGVAGNYNLDLSRFKPSLSGNGRYVAFNSYADNLIDGDTNDTQDIFIHDRHTGKTTTASRSYDGVTMADGSSFESKISENGRYVSFQSEASNLIARGSQFYNVFRHDLFTGQTILVTALPNEGVDCCITGYPSISNDGKYVTFSTQIEGFVLGDTNGAIDIFVADLTAETPTISTVKTDFDGDGKADILWRNNSTGQNYLYLMDGIAPTAYIGINTVGDLNWQIQGVDDFNGDGNADILWRHAITGQNYLYLMDGGAISAHGLINTVTDSSWVIAGTGDFDGDGKADILWRNNNTGLNYLYLMDGVTPKAYAAINTVADSNWQIQGVDDFNGDGKADILWRHAATGQNYLYMMDGSAISAHGLINNVPDLNWNIM